MSENDPLSYPSLTSHKAFAEFVMTRIRHALTEILIDTRTIEFDAFGQPLLSELEYACQRGVKVHVLIDAIGSQNFIKDHPSLFARLHTRIRIQQFPAAAKNRIVFDRSLAVVGSHDLRASGPGDGNMDNQSSLVISGPAAVEIAKDIDMVWQNAKVNWS